MNAIQALYQLSYTPKVITIDYSENKLNGTITIVLKFACFVNEFSRVKAKKSERKQDFLRLPPVANDKSRVIGNAESVFSFAVPFRPC